LNKKIYTNPLFILDQERFRSLTQGYYRKAECVLLMFDIFNLESFNNLNFWHSDLQNYCKNQGDRFAIVLVGIKNKFKYNTGNYQTNGTVDQNLIQKFVEEKDLIIGYCEVDISEEEYDNLKEPFAILLDYFLSISQSRPISTNPFIKESQNSIENLEDDDEIHSKSNKHEKECCIII
jgi:GTPase SAR1 family protein